MKKIFTLIVMMLVAMSAAMGVTTNPPKREFRGAWIQCVNGQYFGKSPAELRRMLSSQLDVLQRARINAIIFQVRAEGDALYRSKYEPWSRYLTGTQGLAPADGWDPLAWMVEECHKRNMELHAWINPYRAKTKGTKELASNHAAIRHPERMFRYGDLLIFNPALKENIDYTCDVVRDIVERYDVDGIHIDDYFYPYPEPGVTIPDADYYAHDRRGFNNIGDWRRDNVNRLIKELHKTIHDSKPWVKFGVSPFGIYRNDKSGMNSARGSATSGLQNYDDLYADIVLWQDKGWVDYLVPQIYWNIGTKAADYDVLCHWWNDYCSKRPLYIGQDVERTVKGKDPQNPSSHQMPRKYAIQRSLPNVQGSCQWYAAAVVNNPGNYRTLLETNYHRFHALQPEMPFIDNKEPKKPKKLRIEFSNSRTYLTWKAPKGKKEMDKAVQYVVYMFPQGVRPDTDDARYIAAITRSNSVALADGLQGYTIMVTALDRMHNESKPIKIKL